MGGLARIQSQWDAGDTHPNVLDVVAYLQSLLQNAFQLPPEIRD
jgi:hypothetical protein